MTTAPNEISREYFDALCRMQKLMLAPEEADLLFQAFQSLKPMLDRIPPETDFSAEPAFVWSPGGARLTR